SFMILRNYKGREVSIGRQQLRSQRVLDWLHEIVDFPVVKETYNEILHEVMDVDHAREILQRLESGEIAVAESDFAPLPSPFADVRKWAGQLMDEGVVESVWTPQGIHWALKDQVPNYVAVYAQRSRLKPPEEKVLALLKEKPRTHKELLRATKREKDALNESLRKLERSYLVARRGVEETLFVAREPTRGPFEEALDKILTKRLDMDGPYGATELAVALG